MDWRAEGGAREAWAYLGADDEGMVELDVVRAVSALDPEGVRDAPLHEELGCQVAVDVPREPGRRKAWTIHTL